MNTGSGTNNDQSLNENLNSTLGPITSNNQQASVLPNQPYASTINSSSVALTTTSLVPSEIPIDQQFSLLPPEAFNPTFSDNTPPDTVIPLVTDSNTGSAIQNGGASDSSSILSVTFDGLDETGNSIAGYQCSIDGTSNYCTSPITLDNNNLGTDEVGSTLPSANTHIFQVRAVDAAGNVNPSPASFEWNVVNTNAQAQDANALGGNVQDTNAPDTQIMSVVDSNNAAVLNGSSVSISSSSAESPAAYQFGTSGSAANTTASNTDANALTFSFAGTDDSNIISGYECTSYVSSSLPEQVDFVPCTNPFMSQQLSVEPSEISTDSGTGTTHIFQVRATDTSGNVDPTPATFLWTITPDTGTLEDVADSGIEVASQQDPLLQQQQQLPTRSTTTTTTTAATRSTTTTTTTAATRSTTTTTTTAATRSTTTTTTTAATRSTTTTTTAATRSTTTTTTAATRSTTTTTATTRNHNSGTVPRNRAIWTSSTSSGGRRDSPSTRGTK